MACERGDMLSHGQITSKIWGSSTSTLLFIQFNSNSIQFKNFI